MADAIELAAAIRNTYLRMYRRTEEAVGEFGLSPEQYAILTAIADEPNSSLNKLARKLTLPIRHVRRLLQPLESRRLVTRETHPNDGRIRTVGLSVQGAQVLSDLSGAGECVHVSLTHSLRPVEIDSLTSLLERVCQSLNQLGHEPRHPVESVPEMKPRDRNTDTVPDMKSRTGKNR